MSFREKSALACFVTTGVVFLPYFTYIFRMAGRGGLTVPGMIGAFIGAVIVQAVLSIVYQLAIVIRTRAEPKDERDLMIEGEAFRWAHWVLVVALWVAIPGCITLYPVYPQFVSVAFLAQLVLLCFVVSELVHYGTQVYRYRQGR